MDIVSDPAFTEETVTDFDIVTSTGLFPITCRAHDTVDFHSTQYGEPGIVFVCLEPPETTIFFSRQIIGMRIRSRIIRRPVKTPTGRQTPVE